MLSPLPGLKWKRGFGDIIARQVLSSDKRNLTLHFDKPTVSDEGKYSSLLTVSQQEQGRLCTCRVGGQVQRYSNKFETIILTNSRSPNIFRRNIKISDNPTISKKLRGHDPLLPATTPLNGGYYCNTGNFRCRNCILYL